MREHQIVISLKSDQFQQVQRMARAEGVNSVSVFVRHRLLSSLGLDGQEQSNQPFTGPDWQHISGQLRRLHRELQVFIAESLSTGQWVGTEEPPMFIVPEENIITQGAPILVEENPDYVAYQEQKQLAQRREALGRNRSETNAAELSGRKILEPSNDEMEQLADRAFAISPRLGAIESAPMQTGDRYDPLQDLLEEKLVNQNDDQEEDQTETDTFEDEMGPVDQSAGEANLAEESARDEEDSQSQQGAAHSDEFLSHNQDEATSDQTDDREDAQYIDDADDDEQPDENPAPPVPPPISGGPPPRKRTR